MKLLEMPLRVVRFDPEYKLPTQSPRRRAYLREYRKRYLLQKREKIVAYRKEYYRQNRDWLIAKNAADKRARRKRKA